MYIDTHCHLDLFQFDCDRKDAYNRAKEAGVTAVINPAVSAESCKKVFSVIDEFSDVYAAAGIHPNALTEMSEGDIDIVREYLGNDKTRAVGEIGLDFYWDKTPAKTQFEYFELFLSLSLEFDKPLIIHCRQAYKEIFPIIDNFKDRPLRGVFHCFSGTEDDTRSVLDRGFNISFCGNITYGKTNPLRDCVKLVPVERMVLETDSPYLSPVPHRGKRCESFMIADTAAAIAGLKGIKPQELAEVTTDTAKRLFGI